jgi:hypothetical protein
MPVASSSATLLRGGEFYSPLQARLRTDDVLLSELRQRVRAAYPATSMNWLYCTTNWNVVGTVGTLGEVAFTVMV